MFKKCFLIIFNLIFLYEITCSYIEVFENFEKIDTYSINTPPFDLGNLDFPVNATTIVVVKGCSGARKLSSDQIKNWILFVEYSDSDSSCFEMEYIFVCQDRPLCVGVLTLDYFWNPTGYTAWSTFDKHRPRSAYKVPLVQATKSDFNKFVNLISETTKNINRTYTITLTKDYNPWGDVFSSGGFTAFRVITALWSAICLVLCILLLDHDKRKQKSLTKKVNNGQNFTLKQICICFQALTHISRIVFLGVDPFKSQQIYSNLVYYILLDCSTSYEIVTNMLLAFFIRELTHSRKIITQTQRKPVYFLSVLFLLMDMSLSLMAGLYIRTSDGPNFAVKAFFYVGLNIGLGLWYLWEAASFFRVSKSREKVIGRDATTAIHRTLVWISVLNSIGMILVGSFLALTSVQSIFGSPQGFCLVYFTTTIIFQLTSFLQLFLFSGQINFLSVFFKTKYLLSGKKTEVSI